MATRNFEIIKGLTLSRIWNIFLLKFSFYMSRLLKKPVHWGTPIAISIEPTTACNLECPSGLRQFTRPTGNLKSDIILKYLKGSII